MADDKEPSFAEINAMKRNGFSNIQFNLLPERPLIYRRLQEMNQKANLNVTRLYIADNDLPQASNGDGYIVLSKSLVNLLNDREIVAVMGHEMGHMLHKNEHHFNPIAALSVIAGGMVAAGTFIGLKTYNEFKFPQLNENRTRREFLKDMFGYASVAAPVGALGYLAHMQLQIHNYINQECEADDEGANLSGDKEAMRTALEKVFKTHNTQENDPTNIRIERLR